MLSSGITYSSTSLRGRPLAVPCRAVDGIASSKIAPLSVVSCSKGKTHQTFLKLNDFQRYKLQGLAKAWNTKGKNRSLFLTF